MGTIKVFFIIPGKLQNIENEFKLLKFKTQETKLLKMLHFLKWYHFEHSGTIDKDHGIL